MKLKGVVGAAVVVLAAKCGMVNAQEGEKCEGEPQLTVRSISENVLNAHYAVRGPVLLRALQIEADLKEGKGNYPFSEVVKCNIGNPQALGQKPITFTRQVLALTLNPDLLSNQVTREAFPSDAIERAEQYLKEIRSVGAYSESQGVTQVRKEVAEFITNRDDGVPAYPENIFLSEGASQGVQQMLTMLIRSKDDALLIPIPQYPLYSALVSLLGGHMAGYYIGDSTGWDVDIEELKRALVIARENGKSVRAVVVINPGNPTGSTLTVDQMRDIVAFCRDENLVLLADEVYQTNVYRDDKPFVSFRKVAHSMGLLGDDGRMKNGTFQLASFHSVSKGVVGECGLRGGYVEYLGFEQSVKDQVYKMASIGLCSNVPGQLAIGLMVNPPKPGSPSYDLYAEERASVFESLKRRAAKLEMTLNSVPGVKCHPIEGAMYAFPEITLPQRFVDESLAKQQQPDQAYSIALLEQTGLVVVPGSGFGQRDNTFHFRTTFLPPEDSMDRVLDLFRSFHVAFVEKYK